MLILERDRMESVIIENKNGEDILITVLSMSGGRVKLGITAPKDIYIHRQEVYDKIIEEGQAP